MDIGAGSAAILVYDESLKSGMEAAFYKQLISEGFVSWGKHGCYSNCPWVFVNINSKTFAPGMPGIKITQPLGDHAVTVDEFWMVYNIYKKYYEKDVLKF